MSSSSRYIEKRLRYFEESTRFILETLELITSLGDCRGSVNRLESVTPILDEAESKITELIPFEAVTFYLVNEDTNDFEHHRTRPVGMSDFAYGETEYFINTGEFAWAVVEKRPMVAASRSKKSRFVLHAIGTRSRTRGMFIGLLPEGTRVPDIKLSLLTLVLMDLAGSLESFHLYGMVRREKKMSMELTRYRNVFNLAPYAMELIDRRGRIVDCNEACLAMLACGRDDVVGRPRTHFFSAESAEEYRKKLSPKLKKEGICEGELQLINAAGESLRVWRTEKAAAETETTSGSKEFLVFYRVLAP